MIQKKFGYLIVWLVGFLTSCFYNGQNRFYFANFESYISMVLVNQLKTKYSNFNLRTFPNNENLEANFHNYDSAIATTNLVAKLINDDKLAKIDWSSFNLNKLDEKGRWIKKNGKIVKITNANDALSLFTKQTQEILQQEIIKKNQKQKINLLEYGIPYFLQDVAFAYKKNIHTKLNEQNNNWVDWKKFVDKIPPLANQNQLNHIAVIDDSSTLYSLARLVQTSNTTTPTVMVEQQENQTVNSFKETYQKFFGAFKRKNQFLFNSDSTVITNDFANPNGSQGAIFYNGDLLYALQGGDDFGFDKEASDNFKNWFLNYATDTNFHLYFQKPQQNLLALDMYVINKNSQKIKQAHDIAKKITLEGSDQPLYDQTNQNYNLEAINKVDENDEYVYGPMLNFDEIVYSSPLKTLDAYVLNSFNLILDNKINPLQKENSLVQLQNNGYFTNLYSDFFDNDAKLQKYKSNYINLLVYAYLIPLKKNTQQLIEKSISDLNKSNMYYAYVTIINNL